MPPGNWPQVLWPGGRWLGWCCGSFRRRRAIAPADAQVLPGYWPDVYDDMSGGARGPSWLSCPGLLGPLARRFFVPTRSATAPVRVRPPSVQDLALALAGCMSALRCGNLVQMSKGPNRPMLVTGCTALMRPVAHPPPVEGGLLSSCLQYRADAMLARAWILRTPVRLLVTPPADRQTLR